MQKLWVAQASGLSNSVSRRIAAAGARLLAIVQANSNSSPSPVSGATPETTRGTHVPPYFSHSATLN
jgi:hypothetical protein